MFACRLPFPALRNVAFHWLRGGASLSTSSQQAPPGDDLLPRLVDIRQGDKVNGVFSPAEFDKRLAVLRKHMDDNDIGACVLTSYHCINYFSGFLYCYFGRPFGLVITPEKSVTLTPKIDGGQPWRRCHGDNVAYTDWKQDNFYYAVTQQLQGIKGKVGLEFDHLSLDNYKKMDATAPNLKKVDVGNAAMHMRLLKSPEEISVIRQGARIADIGGAAAVSVLREGVSEHEVALASTSVMVNEIAKTYPDAELMDTWSWFQSGINTDSAHGPVTSRKLQKGDILSLNCFPIIGGYYTALERTMFLDHASDEALRIWEVNCRVQRRGQELIKPGVRCCDVVRELNEIFREAGLLQYKGFGYGYSFGSLSHYYGREAALELREDIETVLEPNMVVSMVPMLTIPEGRPGAGGYREHNILIVNETGSENITWFPFGPEHNIIKA